MFLSAARRLSPPVAFEAQWRRVSRMLALCGFGAVAATGELSPPAIAVFAGLWLAAWVVGAPRFWRPWMGSILVLAAAGAIGLVALRETFSGVLYLLCLLAASKVFALSTPRDHMHVVIVSFLMILASSVIMISAAYILFMLAFLTLLIADLSMMSAARDAARAEGGEWRGRPAPARPLRRAFGMACGVLALSVALFYVIPHTAERSARPGNWQPEAADTATSGFTNELDVRALDHIAPDDTVAMTVYAHWDRGHTGPLPATLRLRGAVLDSFDGGRWTRAFRLGRSVASGQEPDIIVRKRRGGEVVLVQQIDQDMANGRNLFATSEVLRYHFQSTPVPPMRLDARSGLLWLAGNNAQNPPLKRLEYTVYSTPAPEGFESRASSGGEAGAPLAPEPLTDVEKDIYTAVPRMRGMSGVREDGADSFLRKLVESEKLGGFPDPRARVARLIEWFDAEFAYTLSPQSPRGMNPVVGFLMVTHKGHCELFASSLVLLLRAQGVPARIVTGYYVAASGTGSNAYIVRRSDAHAWTEVWFPDTGWTIVDPTPPDHRGRASYGSSLEIFWVQQVSTMRSTWRKFMLNYNQATQGEMIQTVLDTPAVRALRDYAGRGNKLLARVGGWFDMRGRLGAWGAEHALFALCLSFLLSGLALAGAAALLWMFARRLARLRAGDKTDRSTVAFMNVLLARLRRQGLTREAGQTPVEFLTQASGLISAEQAEWLAELYHKTRFGGHRPSRGELAEALRIVKGAA